MAPELEDMSIEDMSDDMLDGGQSDIIDELDIIELSMEEDIELSIIELDMQSSIIDELDVIEESIADDELL